MLISLRASKYIPILRSDMVFAPSPYISFSIAMYSMNFFASCLVIFGLHLLSSCPIHHAESRITDYRIESFAWFIFPTLPVQPCCRVWDILPVLLHPIKRAFEYFQFGHNLFKEAV